MSTLTASYELDGMPMRCIYQRPTSTFQSSRDRPSRRRCPTASSWNSPAAEEIAERAQTRTTRAARKAKFLFLHMIEEFDFTLQTSLWLKMFGPELLGEGRSACSSEPCGTARRMSCPPSPAQRSNTALKPALFPLNNSSASFLMPFAWARPTKLPSLTSTPMSRSSTNVGYLGHAPADNVLYRVVVEPYLRGRPILMTTKKPLAALGHAFHHRDLSEAILDRLPESGRRSLYAGTPLAPATSTHRKEKPHGVRIAHRPRLGRITFRERG